MERIKNYLAFIDRQLTLSNNNNNKKSLPAETKIYFLLESINTMSSRLIMKIEKNINWAIIVWSNTKFSEPKL